MEVLLRVWRHRFLPRPILLRGQHIRVHNRLPPMRVSPDLRLQMIFAAAWRETPAPAPFGVQARARWRLCVPCRGKARVHVALPKHAIEVPQGVLASLPKIAYGRSLVPRLGENVPAQALRDASVDVLPHFVVCELLAAVHLLPAHFFPGRRGQVLRLYSGEILVFGPWPISPAGPRDKRAVCHQRNALRSGAAAVSAAVHAFRGSPGSACCRNSRNNTQHLLAILAKLDSHSEAGTGQEGCDAARP